PYAAQSRTPVGAGGGFVLVKPLVGPVRRKNRGPLAAPGGAEGPGRKGGCGAVNPLVGPVGRKDRGRLAPLGGVERPRRKVRFARLIHRRVRAFRRTCGPPPPPPAPRAPHTPPPPRGAEHS